MVGNPPFKGAGSRSHDQQKDIIKIFGSSSKADYVSLWFIKGSEYLKKYIDISSLSFVATNSLNQGEQVDLIWKKILQNNISILFANRSFIWKNNAVNNAGVTVSIIGLGKSTTKKKQLFHKENLYFVNNINPYLYPGKNIFISKLQKPISFNELMIFGDMANDGDGLILKEQEYLSISNDYPDLKKYLRKYTGAAEFLKGTKRWCIWCNEEEYEILNKIEFFNVRFEKIKIHRNNSSRVGTKKYANKPFRFTEIRKRFENAIIVPRTSSEKRNYFPVGMVDKETIISDGIQVIYGGSLLTFSILSSKIHLLWLKTVGGRLTDRLRYSSQLVYNTFPFEINDSKIADKLENLALELIDAREKYSDRTISELYDPNKMPKSILQCHSNIDDVFESTYKTNGFNSDEEKIEYLFNLYVKSLDDNILL